MKAAQISEYGDTSVLKVNEIDKPIVGAGKVLVEVYATSLNPFDSKLRQGFMKDGMPLEFPATLGSDMAGVVAKVGPGVEGFAVGDKVYGSANLFGGGSGAFAEFALTRSDRIAKMPENVDFNQAAALPLTGVSALQALQEHINLQPGQKILIHGGAGGIGSLAIQIAKNFGAYVATTAEADAVDFVRGLGANEVINYKNQKFEDVIEDYDAVFDTVGGETFERSFAVLKKGGTLVSMIAQDTKGLAERYGIKVVTQLTQITADKLSTLAALVKNNVLNVQINGVFKFEEIAKAFDALEAGGIHGKVVVTIKD